MSQLLTILAARRKAIAALVAPFVVLAASKLLGLSITTDAASAAIVAIIGAVAVHEVPNTSPAPATPPATPSTN